MKVVVALLGLSLTAALGAGTPSPHEDAVKQVLAVQDKITSALATITDQSTADTAKPQLRKFGKEFIELRGKIEKLPPPSREEKGRLEKEYKSKLEAAQRKLSGEVLRVQNIPGGREALQEIRGVLDKRVK